MDVHNILRKIAEASQRCVLVTTISVEGHAYRKVGAMMLLMEDGSTIGSISPGCMEADLMERVSGIIATDTIEVVEYDMKSEDDVAWGEAIGCGGTVRVLLEPVSGALLEHLLEVKQKLDQRIAVSLIRFMKPDNKVVTYKLVAAGQKFSKNHQTRGLNEKELLFSRVFSPKPRLIIFGAGNDAMPIVELARLSGFQLVIADWRSGLCTKERFGDAAFVVGFPKKTILHLDLTDQDYVIVMSHHLRLDREFVQGISSIRLKYVGIMGSDARSKQVLEDIAVPSWFHYPVGLHISAEGPEEIAISVLAEIIKTRRAVVQEDHLEKDDAYEAKHNWDLYGRGKKQSDGSAQALHRASQR